MAHAAPSSGLVLVFPRPLKHFHEVMLARRASHGGRGSSGMRIGEAISEAGLPSQNRGERVRAGQRQGVAEFALPTRPVRQCLPD